MKREKSIKLVVSFHTTSAAMAFEKHCQDNDIAGRIIPLPSQISASCGLAWCADISMKDEMEGLLLNAGISWDGIYEIEMY